MNFAFPVLILTLALLPGSIFRYSMLRGWYRRTPITFQQALNDLLYAIPIACIIHMLSYWVASQYTWAPDLKTLLHLIMGPSMTVPEKGPAAELLTHTMTELTTRPWSYGLYFFLTLVLGSMGGLMTHGLLREKGKSHLLRNEWHSLLDSQDENIAFTRKRCFWHSVHLVERQVYATAVVDLKSEDGPSLFRGLVTDWTFDEKGEVQKLILRDVARRPLKKDRDRSQPFNWNTALDERYYPVEGDRFILQISECITLNFQYLIMLDEEDVEHVEENQPIFTPAFIGQVSKGGFAITETASGNGGHPQGQ